MPRNKFYGFLASIFSISAGAAYIYLVFADNPTGNFFYINNIFIGSDVSYYTIAFPVALVSLAVVGTGFWIGLTILSIKVVPPMPELVEKKDTTKFKAVLLCAFSLSSGAFMIYGMYIKSYWAIAIPSAIIAVVILGAVFWVGLAILTTRRTLPEKFSEKK
jgi:uncharacterized protein with PQ loop repeat